MKLSSFIYPAPKPSYSANSLLGELIYVPKRRSNLRTANQRQQAGQKRGTKTIPCLFLPFQTGSSKLMLYFHGNAEDLGLSYEILDHMRNSFKLNILAVEYPGYGIYEDPEGTSDVTICEDA